MMLWPVRFGVCMCVSVCSCGSCPLCEPRLWHPVPFPCCLSIWRRASLSELCITVGYSPIITVENAGIQTQAGCSTVHLCLWVQTRVQRTDFWVKLTEKSVFKKLFYWSTSLCVYVYDFCVPANVLACCFHSCSFISATTQNFENLLATLQILYLSY